MTTWYLGTIGYAYKVWRGLFYPPTLDSGDYLAAYSQIFNAVEMDTTFHAVPPVERVSGWKQGAAAGFKFAPKAPRAVTHEFRIPDSINRMLDYLQVMRHFGDKLGPILIQWPPHFSAEQGDRLDVFLDVLPKDLRYAVEFRHNSWYTEATAELLVKHRAAWVAVDYVHSPRRLVRTTDFLFIRWLGEHGRYERGQGEHFDPTPQLQWWQQALEPHLRQVEAVYGFFNDDYTGYAPATCNRFKALRGLPTQHPQFPHQPPLF